MLTYIASWYFKVKRRLNEYLNQQTGYDGDINIIISEVECASESDSDSKNILL